MPIDLENMYRDCPIPKNLSFDEESLFWRLRMGEGLPHREWHKPLNRGKSWQQIKLDLDKKLQIGKTSALFHQIYPSKGFLCTWLAKLIKSLKKAF